MFQRIKVTPVIGGDGLGHVALLHRCHHAAYIIDGINNVIQGRIDTFDNLAEIPLMTGRVGARGQTALDGGSRQHVCICHQRVDGINTGIQIVLDGVEITIVGIGNRGRNIALGNAVNVIGRHIERANNRIQRRVHALDNLAVFTLIARGIRTGCKMTINRRCGQTTCFSTHGLDRIDGLIQSDQHLADLIASGCIDFHIKVTSRNLLGNLHRISDRTGNASSDEPAQRNRQQQGYA